MRLRKVCTTGKQNNSWATYKAWMHLLFLSVAVLLELALWMKRCTFVFWGSQQAISPHRTVIWLSSKQKNIEILVDRHSTHLRTLQFSTTLSKRAKLKCDVWIWIVFADAKERDFPFDQPKFDPRSGALNLLIMCLCTVPESEFFLRTITNRTLKKSTKRDSNGISSHRYQTK